MHRRGPKRRRPHPIIRLRNSDESELVSVPTHQGNSPIDGTGFDKMDQALDSDFAAGSWSNPEMIPQNIPPSDSSHAISDSIQTNLVHSPPRQEESYAWDNTGTEKNTANSDSGLPQLEVLTHSMTSGTSAAWPLSDYSGMNDVDSILLPSFNIPGLDIGGLSTPMVINWHSVNSTDPILGDPVDHQLDVPACPLPAESVVHQATKYHTDVLLMLTVPPYPEPHEKLRHRLVSFFHILAPYMPMLHQGELMAAFEAEEQDRSIHFRALTLSMFAMAAASGLHRSTYLTAENETSLESPDEAGMSEQVKTAYLRDAQLANSLCDSDGNISIANVTTSLHLFLTFEWLKDHNRSWSYLQQAVTRAQELKIDHVAHIETNHGPDGNGPACDTAWWATRLRLYYILTLIERSHALLRPASVWHAQALRLPGRPWIDTCHLRESLPTFALNGVQVQHVRSLDVVDDRVIKCWREKQACGRWTTDAAVTVQLELGQHLNDIISSRFASHKDMWHEGRLVNAVMTVAHLRTVIYEICVTHSLIDPDSRHQVLHPSFVVEILRQAIQSTSITRAVQRTAMSDGSRDTFGKLYDMTMITLNHVDKLIPQQQADLADNEGTGFASVSPLTLSEIEQGRKVIMQSLGILCNATDEPSTLGRLVQGVAKLFR
ncbi:hypothetical protein BCR39DRAFT_546817 [Naematelia encephala]|uniref:Transcription factor domain-containing protein n=1 Tax=Naematelia encephala TaxID=71784 RepID=A0A1Y2APL8_9TREE|nr:hypothetical protein BCR39DRAFT_546817 [Naematelia encephala]